jgi:hypothetical protein
MNPAITNRHRPMTDERVELWETFGCIPPSSHRDGPTVRPVLDKSGAHASTTYRDYDCLDPDTGVHFVQITLPNGVLINAHGDDTNGVYVAVYGLSPEATSEMYRRVEAAIPTFLRAVWTTT